MLRALVLLLLAANLAFFAWTRGWLGPVLLPPMSSEREPERLSQQVRPEAITVLSPAAADAARRAEAASQAARAAASDAARTAASAPPARPAR